MNKNILNGSWLAWLAALALAGFPVTMNGASAQSEDKGFLEKMEQWQGKMSEKFRDTWKSLRGDDQAKSVATASLDLREDKDVYTVRLNLPDRDLQKVEINFAHGALRVVSPAGDKVGRYEQTIELAAARPDAVPRIDRNQKDNMIVVTVPKDEKLSPSADASPRLPDPALLPLTEWEADVFTRMEKMRRDMDRAFNESFHEFQGSSLHGGFFDEPRFGSSLDLQDEGDKYIVRAYLPDRDVQNVEVALEGQTLRIQAREQPSARNDDAEKLHSSRKAAFSQWFTLPGPVQGEKMEVAKKEGMLVITLPKAK